MEFSRLLLPLNQYIGVDGHSGSHSPVFEPQFCLTWLWDPSLGLSSPSMGGAARPSSKGGDEGERRGLRPCRSPALITLLITTTNSCSSSYVLLVTSSPLSYPERELPSSTPRLKSLVSAAQDLALRG